MSAAGAAPVLVLVEHAAGVPEPASLAALAVGRGLAAALGAPLQAVALGPHAGTLSATLGANGVEVLRVAGEEPGADAAPFDAPAVPGQALAGLLQDIAPRVLLAAGSLRGTETLAHAAALAGIPFAAGCTSLEPDADGALAITRLRWAGSVFEEATLAGPTVCATLADGAVAAGSVDSAADPAGDSTGTPATCAPASGSASSEARVERFAVAASPELAMVRLVERAVPEGGRVALGTARVVVGGGRGVGGPAGFEPIEELASLLGAAVGVSRVVTSAGWRPHTEQVGQTGTRIAPDLYIACGISGAIQHIVACRSARAILAINSDPEAPIMARATHAVIGDLHEVVPAISAELRRRGVRPA